MGEEGRCVGEKIGKESRLSLVIMGGGIPVWGVGVRKGETRLGVH